MSMNVLIIAVFVLSVFLLACSKTAIPATTHVPDAQIEDEISIPTVSPFPTLEPATQSPLSRTLTVLPATNLPDWPIYLISFSTDGTPELGVAPQISSMGTRLAYRGVNGFIQLRVLPDNNKSGSNEITSYSLPDFQGVGLSLSGDGNSIAFFSATSALNQGCPQNTDWPCASLSLYFLETEAMDSIPAAADLSGLLSTSLSNDGRFLAFSTRNALLHEGIFLYERETGELTAIVAGDIQNDSDMEGALVDISGDGRFIAFTAANNDIVPDDDNNAVDVFIFEQETGQIERISHPYNNIESEEPSGFQRVPNTGGAFERGLAISDDGRYVIFMSTAPNLINMDLPPCNHWPWANITFPACRHIYLYDRQTTSMELISLSSEEEPGNLASEDGGGDISADGRFVIFTSRAANLTPNFANECIYAIDAGPCPQVYLRDRKQGRTYLVSQGKYGSPPDGASYRPVISADGRVAAFVSTASNLTVNSESANGEPRVYFVNLSELTQRQP